MCIVRVFKEVHKPEGVSLARGTAGFVYGAGCPIGLGLLRVAVTGFLTSTAKGYLGIFSMWKVFFDGASCRSCILNGGQRVKLQSMGSGCFLQQEEVGSEMETEEVVNNTKGRLLQNSCSSQSTATKCIKIQDFIF